MSGLLHLTLRGTGRAPAYTPAYTQATLVMTGSLFLVPDTYFGM